VGVMGHFAFSKAYDLSKGLNIFQVGILYVVAFFIIIIMPREMIYFFTIEHLLSITKINTL